MLLDLQLRSHIAKLYSTSDMAAAGQAFVREVTPELCGGLSGTG